MRKTTCTACSSGDIKELKQSVSNCLKILDGLEREIGGSKYGRIGIVERQRLQDGKMEIMQKEIDANKRIRAEVLFLCGLIGALVAKIFDWTVDALASDRD